MKLKGKVETLRDNKEGKIIKRCALEQTLINLCERPNFPGSYIRV